MREDLLHFLWKFRKLQAYSLHTTHSEPVTIVDWGQFNHLSGPDFFNAKIEIGGQLWAGNVEMHLKTSDWYVHGHEQDPNYHNVILHVVWEDDSVIFRKDGSEIPTLELQHVLSSKLLQSYQDLFDHRKQKFINCEDDISDIDSFIVESWLTRLYFERLQQKSIRIRSMLKDSINDWEQVFFKLLLRNFGLTINRDSFFSLAEHLNFGAVRKEADNVMSLESLLYGMSHLLEDDGIVDAYYVALRKEFEYLRRKYGLDNMGVLKPEFFKLRPSNFPTLRLSQFAGIYSRNNGLFELVIHATDLRSLYAIFACTASPYWDDHYTFGKPSKGKPKKVTKAFIDLLIINTVLPFKFCYFQALGKDVNDTILRIVDQIKGESNSIVKNFQRFGVTADTALQSQALLQLHSEYCTRNRCLDCTIGSRLLDRNVYF